MGTWWLLSILTSALGLAGTSLPSAQEASTPFRSLHRDTPLVCHHLVASVKQGYHVSRCPNFLGPLSAIYAPICRK